MQDILSPNELKARLGAIRLTPEELSRAAGVANTTVHRFVDGQDARRSTHLKISAALEAEERRLLHHLLALHGVPASAGAAA